MKRSKACEFNKKARDEIIIRDRGECIFCKIGYMDEGLTPFEKQINGIMHYIPRSQGGLGIPENGALGCNYHHNMLDNGNKGNRQEMLNILKNYLTSIYPDWNEEKLIYKK